jgi:prefoldin subunit 5
VHFIPLKKTSEINYKIGNHMNKEIENLEEQTNILFKIVNKLEQRIASLEKVLASHAKCIGEMRGDDDA